MTNGTVYAIGDGWLTVAMTAKDADQWNSYTLPLDRLRELKARRSDAADWQTLGEMLDADDISRDDLADRASSRWLDSDGYL